MDALKERDILAVGMGIDLIEGRSEVGILSIFVDRS